jgi:hypothetical protein
MFNAVFENLRTATDLTIQTQQDLFKKWIAFWEGTPPFQPVKSEQAQKFQKKWTEAVTETLKRQREAMETQFTAGLKSLEAAFAVTGAKDIAEVRAKSVELWEKSFDCLRKAFEAQTGEFQAALARWTELVTKGAA